MKTLFRLFCILLLIPFRAACAHADPLAPSVDVDPYGLSACNKHGNSKDCRIDVTVESIAEETRCTVLPLPPEQDTVEFLNMDSNRNVSIVWELTPQTPGQYSFAEDGIVIPDNIDGEFDQMKRIKNGRAFKVRNRNSAAVTETRAYKYRIRIIDETPDSDVECELDPRIYNLR